MSDDATTLSRTEQVVLERIAQVMGLDSKELLTESAARGGRLPVESLDSHDARAMLEQDFGVTLKVDAKLAKAMRTIRDFAAYIDEKVREQA